MLFLALDTVIAISEKQKILQKQREEIEEIERNVDREVSCAEKRWRIFSAPEMLQTNKGMEQNVFLIHVKCIQLLKSKKRL